MPTTIQDGEKVTVQGLPDIEWTARQVNDGIVLTRYNSAGKYVCMKLQDVVDEVGKHCGISRPDVLRR